MTSELKPCPFCGGEPVVFCISNTLDDVKVICEGCGAGSKQSSKREVIAKTWNRRIPPPGYALVPLEDEARVERVARAICRAQTIVNGHPNEPDCQLLCKWCNAKAKAAIKACIGGGDE